MKRLAKLGHVGLLVLASTAFVSCDDFYGSFQANEEVKLVHTREKLFRSDKKVDKIFEAGAYSAKLEIESSTKVKLRLAEPGQNADKGKKVLIKLPKSSRLTADDMSVFLKAEETAQYYDIQIDVNTVVDTSDIKFGTQACTYRKKERVKRKVCDDNSRNNSHGRQGGREDNRNNENERNGRNDNQRHGGNNNHGNAGNNNQSNCRMVEAWDMVTKHGRRKISYKDAVSTKFIDLKLLKPGSPMPAATFNSSKVVSEVKVEIKPLSRCGGNDRRDRRRH